MDIHKLKTIGDLKSTDYRSKSIKKEMRDNLIDKIKTGESRFEGIIGYDDSVLPSVENAILAGHDFNLLGLRGQAKTRIARSLTEFLDEYVPVLKGSPLNEDPFQPILDSSKRIIEEKGDETEIEWMHRYDRYAEKLATPDVSIADLIGDIDPIKAANLKLDYASEEIIHFGIIPRSNRSIFVINELPDLQPRIQVSLFNLLQENDIQIRGFKMLLPMDIQFVFTANPEDYTNRGSIITPLKDRIQSQITTHYPELLEESAAITKQEAQISEDRRAIIEVPDFMRELIESISVEARKSEFVDHKSGVSARMAISVLECVVGAAERRILLSGDEHTVLRMGDLTAAIPAITGKIEMVYEGEQEGVINVGYKLISSAIRSMAMTYIPGIDDLKNKEKEQEGVLQSVIDWFRKGNIMDVEGNLNKKEYETTLSKIPELNRYVSSNHPDVKEKEIPLFKEFILHAMAEFSMLDKKMMKNDYHFQDLFSSYFPLEN